MTPERGLSPIPDEESHSGAEVNDISFYRSPTKKGSQKLSRSKKSIDIPRSTSQVRELEALVATEPVKSKLPPQTRGLEALAAPEPMKSNPIAVMPARSR